MKTELENILKRYFSQGAFKPGQKEIITSLLSGKDALAVIHGVSDQSVCYRLPALIMDGMTLVVSRRQIKDESISLLPASHINSQNLQDILWAISDGRYKLLYVNPEEFRNRLFLFALARIPISLLVIEEAQCISRWSYDFQFDYPGISKAIMEMDRQPCILALADPCTQRIQDDILHQLQIDNASRFILGSAPSNLSIEVKSIINSEEKLDILRKTFQGSDGPGIIYTNSRQQTVEICESLKESELEASFYHGGMGYEKRSEVEKAFAADKLRVVSATTSSSFGSGLSKNNIRYIVHSDMPDCLERYYQQISMAGTDNQPARCIVIYSPSDREFHRKIIEKNYISSGEYWRIKDALKLNARKNLVILPYGQLELEAAVDRYKLHVVLREMEKAGMLTVLPDCSILARAHILVPRGKLEEYAVDDAMKSVVKWLMDNSKDDDGDINVDFERLKGEFAHDILENCFISLCYEKAIVYKTLRRGISIHIIDLESDLADDVFDKLKESKYESLRIMEEYIHSRECRQRFLRNYFGYDIDDIEAECRKCDNCLGGTDDAESIITLTKDVGLVKESNAEPINPAKDEDLVIKILRCAEKTDGQVGRCGIMKILRGQRSKKLAKYGFDHIEEYGVLSNVPGKAILEQIDAMIEKGCLTVSSFPFPMLRLTRLGQKRLSGGK